MLLSQCCNDKPVRSKEMFQSLSVIDFDEYSSPESKETGSEIEDQRHLVISQIKGSKVIENITRKKGIFRTSNVFLVL